MSNLQTTQYYSSLQQKEAIIPDASMDATNFSGNIVRSVTSQSGSLSQDVISTGSTTRSSNSDCSDAAVV